MTIWVPAESLWKLRSEVLTPVHRKAFSEHPDAFLKQGTPYRCFHNGKYGNWQSCGEYAESPKSAFRDTLPDRAEWYRNAVSVSRFFLFWCGKKAVIIFYRVVRYSCVHMYHTSEINFDKSIIHHFCGRWTY